MRTGFTVSAIVHTGVIVLAILGLGMGKPLDTTPVESIAVDLVPISDVTNIRLGSLDSKVVDTEAPSAVDAEKPAELAQPTGNATEDQPLPADNAKVTPAPTEQTAPAPEVTAPVVDPDPAPAPDVPPAPAADPAPAPEPVPGPAPEPAAADPVTPDTPLAAPDITEDPAAAAPRPLEKTASLAQKRADFKKQQDAAKQQAAADAKAAADAEAKQLADAKAAADAKAKADAKAVADAKAAADKKKAADAKKDADKKAADQKRIEEAKADQAAKAADDVADIINQEDSRGATTGDGGQKTLGKQDGRSATLSQSQIDGLVAQIRTCINVPAGASDAGSEAQLLFTVGGDGRVLGVPQVLNQTGDALSTAYTGAVTRAVMRCGPYMVVAGQDVKATFRAKDF